MNFKESLKKRLSRATITIVSVLTLGQSFIASVQVLADELSPTKETVTTTDSMESTNNKTKNTESQVVPSEDSVNKVKEIVDNPTLTDTEKAEKMDSTFAGMGKVSFGYTNEAGEKITVQEKQSRFKRSALDTSEYTPYSFRVDLNGYWAEGQMPVLKMDEIVVFCIEPGVAAQVGEGYNPMDLPLNISTEMTKIGAIGYNPNPTHERYVTAQGYIWELMGASFSTSYDGYDSMKVQIDTDISNYFVKPSFSDQTVTVKVGEPITLTDTNNVLPEFVEDVSVGGLNLSKNGNQLTISASVNSADQARVEMWKGKTQGTSIAYQKEGAQTTAKFLLQEPAKFILNVNVIKTGNAEFTKLSDVSDLPMAGVTYKVTVGNEAEKNMKTNAEGKLIFKDITHGTDIFVTEIDNPEGYVLDSTTYKLSIEGGTTVSKKLTNKIQKGRFKGQKFKEVFNPDKTWESGTPIYETVPAKGVEFDVVAKTDIKLPDKKTVVVKAGTVVDKVVTDENGNFTSNTELYIGKENNYQLKETNKPENYRNPSDIQTEFSIPNGSNTEALLFYDLGKIDNLLKTTEVTFNKKNALNLGDILNIAGAEFLVEGLSPNVKYVQFTFTTETKVTAMKLLAGNGTATYKFTEVKAPNGFGQPEGSTETRIITINDGQDLTVDWENMPIMPKIATKAYGENGEKNFDPTVDNTLYDDIHYEGVEVGKEKTLVTKIIEVETGKIIKKIEGQVVFDKQAGTYVVETFIPANTIKKNTKTVFLEYLYNDKEKTEEYAKHDDPSDQDQTVTWTKPEMKIETLFATVNGDKVIDPTIDNKLEDKVKVINVPTDKELTILTQYIDPATGSVISKEEHQRTFKSKNEEFSVFLDLPKNTLKDGQELVATHVIYEDKEKTKEVSRHYDLTNKNQTVIAMTPTKPVTPNTPTTPQKTVGSLPSAGEKVSIADILFGSIIIVSLFAYLVFQSRKKHAPK